jgi:t-SNARE complex subunit (syntaxin)
MIHNSRGLDAEASVPRAQNPINYKIYFRGKLWRALKMIIIIIIIVMMLNCILVYPFVFSPVQ